MIAKSTAESELYGVVRASTEGLGLTALLKDYGVPDIKVRVQMDASAAIGIIERRGLGKLRHIEVDLLWLQEQQARRLVPLNKVPGTRNPSDMMTKNLPVATTEMCVDMLNLEYRAGRADIAKDLHVVRPARRPGQTHQSAAR